ncbi:hypothetical protein ABFX02_12G037900 [Erythranthe guttata]
MSFDICGSSLFLALPDDIFTVITSSLSPRDVCSLGLSCQGLNSVLSSDEVWLSQCNKLGMLASSTLIEWRKGVLSYKALCRFLFNTRPLIGIWVQQNPELGNLVYVMPGFLSVVGCRIIPQKVGPLGLQDGRILWAPVFEILCKYNGSTAFFLHGREEGADYVYPGLLKSVDTDCNVLFLQVEPRHQPDEIDKDVSQIWTEMPFIRLESDDREKLLDFVSSQVRDIVPQAANVLLFPLSRNGEVDSEQDFAVLHERRLLLLLMYNRVDTDLDLRSSEVCRSLDGDHPHRSKGKTLFRFLKTGLKQLLRKSRSTTGDQEHLKLNEFLRPGDIVGLSLRAKTVDVHCYKVWPYMHESLSALYKFPIQAPKASHVYAGLWGGTFGWPPSSDKPGKALFLIFISYENQEMIATKILEGTSYVAHPNGSAMFIVNIDQPSVGIFPWDNEEESNTTIDVKESFKGEGISDGYGFRYPGSKPGSLFVLENGLLVFLWEESREVLTLQRLDLGELLRRGERVNPLSPVSNFVYLTRKYTNVYSGNPDSRNPLFFPRDDV